MKKGIFLSIIMLLIVPQLSLATSITVCEDNLSVPVISATEATDSITLSWDEITNEDLDGYKVVISKNDETPIYPDNGYLSWITDSTVTSKLINNSSTYHNGDFDSYLEAGEDYYFSVTAVYGCGEKVAGNVIHLTYPGESNEEEENECTYDSVITINDTSVINITNNSVKIKWHTEPVTHGKYRYATTESALTNLPWLDTGVENDPDITGRYGRSLVTLNDLQEGTKYYIELKKEALQYHSGPICDSKIITFTTYGDTTDLPVPVLNYVSNDGPYGGAVLNWETIDSASFSGYKVVASKNDSTPVYPSNGYLKYITDSSSTGVLINNSSPYHNGDFGSYFELGEDYYFSVTVLYNNGSIKKTSNIIKERYTGPEYAPKPDIDPLVKMRERAEQLLGNDLGDILGELEQLRNRIQEQENEIKYLRSLVSGLTSITQSVQDALNQFITYGVDENTQKLGAGERAAVIHSFKSAFNKLPETEDEMADAIKIANGRWPSQTSKAAENRAQVDFKKIYLRDADMSNPNDNAAVTVMAYGLRQKAENRNLDSEREGIKTFKYIYGYTPDSTEDWNIMQAITYSGAIR